MGLRGVRGESPLRRAEMSISPEAAAAASGSGVGEGWRGLVRMPKGRD